MSIALVTDSTCDLPKEVLSGLDVVVVPLYILFGEESYRQDVDLDADAFFRKQREASELPHTSQPTVVDFANVYRELLEKGHETIVSLHISSDMSGTIQSATMAREELKGADIRVVDSRNVSVGLGRLVIEADRLLKEGKGADEIVDLLGGLIERVRVIFYVGTLEYLRKGGRIGGARALLGTLLKLKLILQVRDGKIEPLAKARKKARVFERMVGVMMSESSGGNVSGGIVLAHGDAKDDYDSLLAVMPDRFSERVIPTRVGGVVGCHVGPEVVGVAYLPSGTG